jgi:hypothetical protein
MALRSDTVRSRRAARDWDTALNGVPHVGHRAMARHIMAAHRAVLDVKGLARWWLQSRHGYDVSPARPPFVWEGRRGGRRLLVAVCRDEGMACVGLFLAVRLSEYAARQARAGVGVVLLGWTLRTGYPRCSVERWFGPDDFGAGVGNGT